MRTVLEYYDAFGELVISSSFGGAGGDLILSADLALRTKMFRINTTQPTLTGDEVMASVLSSARGCGPLVATYIHAAHLPSRQALVVANRRTYVPTAMPKSVTPRKIDSAGEICRLFADGRWKWPYTNPAVSIPTMGRRL